MKSPLRHPSGVTLIELLLVIGIMALMTLMIVPAIGSLNAASRLTQAGQAVGDRFQLARQHAVTRNQNIQVRIYKINRPAEVASSYCATAIFKLSTDGSAPGAIEATEYLPPGVVIATDPVLSPLLDQQAPVEVDPKFGTNYCALTFRPNGTIDVANNKSWLTIVDALSGNATALPKNYYTVKIAPANGIVKTFRP